MVEDLAYRGVDSIGVYDDGELPDTSLCSQCLEGHQAYAPCTPSKSLPVDAVSLPPRSIKSGITGALSLHDYRKYLSQSAEPVDDLVDRSEKTLKRKTANSNLNRPTALTSLPSSAVSVCSVASTPPPLSPSYSHSVISQRSEQEPEVSEPATGGYQPQAPRVHLVSKHATRPRPNRKRLNTFREKLQRAQDRGQAQHPPLSRPQASDSMLANTQAVATISHGGTSFEILNPRRSLDVARIVSFIEDVDACSLLSTDNRRNSKISTTTFSPDQTFDRTSLSQFTDASLPSHYSSHSLYTSLPASRSTPKMQTTDIPSSSPGVHDRVRSLSDYSLRERNYWSQNQQHHAEQHHFGSYPDLDEVDQDGCHDFSSSPRPPSSSQPTFYSGESEIGEPGSPVYANGEWAQVDERDRGIFYDLPQDQDSSYELPTPSDLPSPTDLPAPYNAYYANTMNYNQHYDPYDPIFDPHVQSVLAAANAETMGLRGHPARALDDLQRRFHSSLSLGGEDRKNEERKSISQRKKLRKLFSWRSGA
ncbi:hypothetical protein N7481_009983 [Penicillium waksmanii]|uniref:uncharacterized protein n=1 Tax=Penicillium waksmanii TaxID=69791 RepID=UPI002548DF01|nr:uncharacterized protein N7481_009983 [Penicillium waksmanii]KAJ5976276.1 hypothetical protein N7481_009983 [Penicillium waksmanii]